MNREHELIGCTERSGHPWASSDARAAASVTSRKRTRLVRGLMMVWMAIAEALQLPVEQQAMGGQIFAMKAMVQAVRYLIRGGRYPISVKSGGG